MPFQAVITYTKLDGMQLKRVCSAAIPVTNLRSHAQSSSDISVLAFAAIQCSAKLAQSRAFKPARDLLYAAQRYFQSVLKAGEDADPTVYNTLCEEYVYSYLAPLPFLFFLFFRYSAFISTCEGLDTELVQMMQKRAGTNMPDQTVQVLHKLRNSTRINFLSGSRKDEVVKLRKVRLHFMLHLRLLMYDKTETYRSSRC